MANDDQHHQHHPPIQHLLTLGLTHPTPLLPCPTLLSEFQILKKLYHAKILVVHPDKGGDAIAFRKTRAAFEVIKSLFREERVKGGSFVNYFVANEDGSYSIPGRNGGANDEYGGDGDGDGDDDDDFTDMDDLYSHYANGDGAVPSYEHFAEAAREDVPGYKIELAKSGRAQCVACKKQKNKDTANNTYIAKGEVRVGSLDENAGSYGRWHHVRCWRVPKKICSGLTTTMQENTNKSDSTEEENQVLQELKSMEGILFSGLSELDGDSQKVIVRHVMDKENWAGSRRKKRKVEEESTNQEKQEEEEKEVAIVSSSTSITSGSASNAKVPIPVSSASDAEMRRRHEAARLAVLNDYSPSTKKKKKVEDAVVLVPPPTTAPIPTLFTVLLNPAEFQSIDKNILKGKCVCISGCFPEIMGGGVDGDGSNNNNEVVGVEAVKQVIVSLGGKVLKSVTKNVDFFLPGKDPSKQIYKTAVKRQWQTTSPLGTCLIINLYTLRQFLLGHVTMDGIKKLPPLVLDNFMKEMYQPGGVAVVSRGGLPPSAVNGVVGGDDAKAKPAAKNTSGKKVTAAKSTTTTKAMTSNAKVKKSSSSESKPSVPAAAAAAAAAAASTVPSSTAVVPLTASSSHASMPTAVSKNAANNSQQIAHPPSNSSTSTTSIVPVNRAKTHFQIPRPGVNGAVAGALDGKRFVLTGVFPELGGGAGLTLGKDKMKKMIESFGGKVTGSVSGKTDFVVVGKAPGASKVGQARTKDIPLMDLLSLRRLLLGQAQLEDVASQPPPRITSFSSGYMGNRIANY